MIYSVENDVLTVCPEGRIDHSNVQEFSAALEALQEQTPHSALIIDAGKLRYISSAGLRVLLAARRREKKLRIVNASAEVYDVLEMTGFTEMMPVERAYRELSVEGCEIIGRGAKGTVYRYDAETVVKVYRHADSLPEVRRERELARKAFVLGIPTAISYEIVRVGDSYGSVFELLDAKSYTQLIAEAEPDARKNYIERYAQLLRQIHSTQVRQEDLPDVKNFTRIWLSASRPYLPPEAAEKLQTLIRQIPDELTMLHCDGHTGNVLMQNGETIVIDMDTLSRGHPVFELANLFIAFVGFGEPDPTAVEAFLGIPYELSKQIWQAFLPAYLGTDDPERVRYVEDRAKLLAYLRRLRHTVRRQKGADEMSEKIIAHCRAEILRLLPQIDTLTF